MESFWYKWSKKYAGPMGIFKCLLPVVLDIYQTNLAGCTLTKFYF